MSRSIVPELNPSQMAKGLVKTHGPEKAASLSKDMAAVNGTDRETIRTQNFWKATVAHVATLAQQRAAQKAAND